MALTVKAVADLAGISIRALHHYDEIGLLKPAGQSASGYRLYSQQDLERLQQILFFRELGFGLKEIREIIDSPGFDRRQALLTHRAALQQRRERIDRLINTVDRTLASIEKEDAPMTKDEMKDLFDGFDPSEHEDEARQRWGGSREFEESRERTRKYTRADWENIKAEAGEIYQNLANLMDRDPGDAAVQEWIGRWHQHINRWYYTCSLEVFRGLGEMYVQDERFTKNIDKTRPGLARFLRDGMRVYCDRREGK